jgi:hypothetical protein
MELIPVHAHVHYKSAFDLILSPNNNFNPKKSIRKWCLEITESNNKILLSSWFFKGDHNQYRIGSHYFRVSTNIGKFSHDDPENWVIEVIHNDSMYYFRKWSAEIALSKIDENSYRFSTIIKNWIQPGFIGEEPPEPSISTPRYVKSIINIKSSISQKGDTALLADPKLIKVGDGKELAEVIFSKKRLLPLIFVSKKYSSNDCVHYTINPWTLQRHVCGNANVYILESYLVNEELNYFLGNGYTCNLGTLRIFMPNIVKSRNNDSLRHRFFSVNQINHKSEDQVLNDISIGISRHAKVFLPQEIYSIQGVISKRRRSRLYTLAKERAENSSQSEELKLLWEELDEITSQISEKDNIIQQLETNIEIVEQEKSDLSWQVNQLENMKSENAELKAMSSVIKSLDGFPMNLFDVIMIAKQVFINKIVFTERALVSAKEYNIKDFNEAWSIIKSIYDHLHNLIFNVSNTDIEREFKNLTGYNLAMTEGRQTKKDKALMKIRKDNYLGKEIDITPHVKWGNKEPKLLRVHFYADHQNKKIVIGHCGCHLDNYSTRKQ